MRLRDRFDRHKRKPSTRNQRIGFAFFWLLVLAFAYFISPDANFNTESHLYPAFSLVDHGTLNIDAYHQRLGDESYWHGHYYTDKAPGISFLAVAPYAALRVFLPQYRGAGYIPYSHMRYAIPRTTVYTRYAITYALVIVPSAIFTLLLWLFLAQLIGSAGWSLLLSAVYAFGTIAYVYSVWLFSHQITAILLFSSFLLVWRHVRGKSPDTHQYVFAGLAGVLAGYAVISEYPTVVIAALIGIYLLTVSSQRLYTGLSFVAGMAPGLVLNLAYNMAAYGQPFATGYAYVRSSQYRSHVHSGVLGLANPLSYGIQAPSLDSLWQITFGAYRGIFLVSPVLVLFFVGLGFMWKRRDLRTELWLSVAVVVLYFLMDASRSVDQNGWSGGWSVASRHLTPVLPFMIVPIAFGLQSKAYRAAFIALGAVSAAIMFMIVSTGAQFAFADRNPLANEMLPRFAHGTITNNWGSLLQLSGHQSLIPLIVIAAGLVMRILWLLRFGPEAVPALHIQHAQLEAD